MNSIILKKILFTVFASLCLLPITSLTMMELTKKSPAMHQTSVPSKEFFLSSSLITASFFSVNYLYISKLSLQTSNCSIQNQKCYNF